MVWMVETVIARRVARRSGLVRRSAGTEAADATAEDGTYVLVNHAFNFPDRGAIGLFDTS